MKFSRITALVLIAFMLLAVAVYVATPLTQTGYVIRNIFYLSAPLIAILFGYIAIWNYGVPNRHALSLFFIVVGLSLWFVGESIFFSYTLVNVDPFPSIADLFYILGYIPLAIGFFRELNILKVKLSGLETLTTLLAAGLFVGLVLYFGLVVAFDSSWGWLASTVSISYNFGDVVLILTILPVLIFVYRHRKGRVVQPWLWYVVALLLTLIADILYSNFSDYYDVLDPLATQIDLIWIVSYLCFGYGFAKQAAILKELSSRAKPDKSLSRR
ncbi:MAG: hypothetical protein V1895_00315 [Parcubacteria group bacterium]